MNILILLTFLIITTSPLTVLAEQSRAPWIGSTLQGAPCKQGRQGFGPFDYTKRIRYAKELHLVESAHFNSNVEQLKGGAKSQYNLAGDIDYTLRAFPNHHRALNSLIRYRVLNGPYTDPVLQQPECYLLRALNFAPEDANTLMLYALYLHKMDRFSEALPHYERALQLAPENLQIQYNLALLLAEMGQYEQAKQYAKAVYAQNYPLQGLKKRLQRAGVW